MKKIKFISIILISIVILHACEKEKPLENRPCPACPYISSVEPDSAYRGDTIVLHGVNFSEVASYNEVKIGDKLCTVLDSPTPTSTELSIQIPENCESGKIYIRLKENDLLTNSDTYVLEKHGAQPNVYIKDGTNPVDPNDPNDPSDPNDPGGNSTPQDTLIISTNPIVQQLKLNNTAVILIDSQLIYLEKNTNDLQLMKTNLKNNLINTTTLSSLAFLKPGSYIYNISRNYRKINSTTFNFLIGGMYDTYEMTYNTSNGNAYLGNRYSSNPQSSYLINGLLYSQNKDNVLFSCAGFTSTPFIGKHSFAKTPIGTDLAQNTVQISFDNNIIGLSANNWININPTQVLMVSKEKLCIYDHVSKGYNYISHQTEGNQPASLETAYPIADCRFGIASYLSRYKDYILLCDKKYGVIRQLDLTNNTIKNIYHSSNLENKNFFILYDETTEQSLLMVEQVNGSVRTWDAYNFYYDD